MLKLKKQYLSSKGACDHALSDTLTHTHTYNYMQELTQLLWSFGTSGFRPDARWLRACFSELAVRRGALTHRELCSSLWALAKLGLDPGASSEGKGRSELRLGWRTDRGQPSPAHCMLG